MSIENTVAERQRGRKGIRNMRRACMHACGNSEHYSSKTNPTFLFSTPKNHPWISLFPPLFFVSMYILFFMILIFFFFKLSLSSFFVFIFIDDLYSRAFKYVLGNFFILTQIQLKHIFSLCYEFKIDCMCVCFFLMELQIWYTKRGLIWDRSARASSVYT